MTRLNWERKLPPNLLRLCCHRNRHRRSSSTFQGLEFVRQCSHQRRRHFHKSAHLFCSRRTTRRPTGPYTSSMLELRGLSSQASNTLPNTGLTGMTDSEAFEVWPRESTHLQNGFLTPLRRSTRISSGEIAQHIAAFSGRSAITPREPLLPSRRLSPTHSRASCQGASLDLPPALSGNEQCPTRPCRRHWMQCDC